MPGSGLEPERGFPQRVLSPQRLPVSPAGLTHDHGPGSGQGIAWLFVNDVPHSGHMKVSVVGTTREHKCHGRPSRTPPHPRHTTPAATAERHTCTITSVSYGSDRPSAF